MTVNAYAVPTAGTMQPWNGVVFPSAGSNWDITQAMTARRARAIPAVGRALSIISSMLEQMPMDDLRDVDQVKLPRPRMLEQPDPDVARSWFVAQQCEDYLLHGNAVQLVTSRSAYTGYPLSTTWVPAEWVTVAREPATDYEPARTSYWVGGTELEERDVIHVRRGADPMAPWRGVGVVEQYLQPLRRIADQESYESQVLNGSAVPSVAIISPNPELLQGEADEAKEAWTSKFAGPKREPAILPNGTQVVPLAWSPHDTQLQEARKLGLQDVANMFNLDGYWLGAPAGSFTYRSPGPMYVNLLRQTVGPLAEVFEGTWSAVWLPRGRRVKFDRQAVLQDDRASTVTMLAAAVSAKILTQVEARQELGYYGPLPAELKAQPVPAALADAANDTTTSGQEPGDGEDDQA